MTWSGLHRCRAAFATFLLVGLMAFPSGGVAGNEPVFSGQAKAITGTVLGLPVTLVDTGPIAAGGGELEANLVCYPNGANCNLGLPDMTGGALQAQALHAAVVAHGNKSRAEASVASFSLLASGQSVGSDLLRSEAEAKCTNNKASISAESEILGLTINGQRITVTGDVNQTIVLPGGGVVIINEQVGSANADTGDVTVNALHVKIPGPLPGTDTDLIVAQAHADIVCGQPNCTGPEKVTGGGFVGNKNNFAIAGKQHASWGHFIYVNHSTGDKMKATQIDPMTFTADGFAVISGLATVNGAGTHTFTAKVKDNGEPGRGSDQFQLTSSHPAMNQVLTTLGGGNIQFHKPCAV